MTYIFISIEKILIIPTHIRKFKKFSMGNLPSSCHPPIIDSPKYFIYSEYADVIFTGGTILTIVESNPIIEAVAIKLNKIIAVGSKKEMLQKHKGIFTKVVELHGTETLMPILIEPHTHPSVLTVYSTNVDLSGFSGEQKIKLMFLQKSKKQ